MIDSVKCSRESLLVGLEKHPLGRGSKMALVILGRIV